jgi:hypothetical protein
MEFFESNQTRFVRKRQKFFTFLERMRSQSKQLELTPVDIFNKIRPRFGLRREAKRHAAFGSNRQLWKAVSPLRSATAVQNWLR